MSLHRSVLCLEGLLRLLRHDLDGITTQSDLINLEDFFEERGEGKHY